MPVPTGSTSERNQFYLFGYPIAHSASPAFHNQIFASSGLPTHLYQLHDTVHPENIGTVIKSDILEIIRSPSFGGCSVTMPTKVTMCKYVDRLGPAAKEIGSINTIFLEQTATGIQCVGENFDWLGVHNALKLALPAAQQELPKPFGDAKCAFIIGGGGTTRAAVYALAQLGLSSIYLVNRDAGETQDIIAAFPQYDLRVLASTDDWTPDHAATVACGVGAIPSFEPVTPEETNVYAIATKIFDSPQPEHVARRPFLEMCYKPRKTIMYNLAAERGWDAITGIEAMIEQGFAQSRSWIVDSKVSRPFAARPEDISDAAKADARALVRGMEDITVPSVKVPGQ